MTNLQEVTGVNFEIALEKFQQDLEDITRNQKCEDVYKAMKKNDLVQEVITLNGQVKSLSESFSSVHLEKGKIDEAFDSLRKQIEGGKSPDCGKNTSLSQFSSMETALKQSQERESELQREMVKANKKISTLENQLKTTKEKLDTAEMSIKDSEKQVLTLKEELLVFTKKESTMADSNKRHENLQREIKDLKSSISVYRQEISDKDGDIKRLRASIADKQSIMEGYVAEITRLKETSKTVATPSKEYESLKLKFDDVCKEKDSLQREVSRMMAKKQTDSSDKEEIHRLRRESFTLKVENDTLRERALSSASQVEGREYDSLQRRYDNLWSEKEVLRKELDTMKSRTRSSSVNIESHRQEIREKEVAIDRLRSENITLQAQIEALKKEAADISARSEYTVRIQSSSVQMDSNEEFYRQEIRERDTVIDKLRADTMTLNAEIDGLKRDMRSYYSRTEFEALQMKYDEILKDRDALREQLMEVRSTSERDVSIHVESRMEGYQTEARDREALIDKLRSENLIIKNELEMVKREISGKSSVSDGYLGEIERLRQEVVTLKNNRADYETLKKTYEEVCKERDFVRNQLMEFKTQSESEIQVHLESYYQAYKQDVREKEIAIDRMRSENTTLRAELEGLRREMSTFYKRTEYESLKLQYDGMWKERDALREELIEFKSKCERDVLIQVENKTVIFENQIREKEMEIGKLRSEAMSIQMKFDGLKRDFESKQHYIESYQSEIERLKSEITTLKSTTVTTTEYEGLRRMYEDVMKERDAIRLELIEFRSNSEREITVQVENQIRIYREEIREKEVLICNMRSESMKFQAEVEKFRRETDSKQFMIEGYLTEIDRLKNEINVTNKRIVELESVRRSYEEVCRERDYLQRQFTDFKSRSEQETTFQIQIQTDGFRQEIKEKEMAIERFTSQNKLLIEEIDGLKRERTTLYSKTEYDSLRQQYEEMWKERDALRAQLVELKTKGERDLVVQIESRTETYRTEIREKETIIGRLQSESLKYHSELETLKRQLGNQEAYLLQIEELKKEVNTLRFPDIRGSAEYISLQRSYEEVCKERDGLRGQVVEIRMKGEQELENQIRIYREQIREKEVEFEKVRMESMTFRSEIEGYKRDLGNQEAYLIEIDRLKKEVNTLRFPDIRGSAEYISLQRTYEEICKERDGLRGQVVEIKMKGDQELENQIRIYREEIREKEVEINRLRSEGMTFKAEIEGYKRDLGNQEAYLIEIDRLKTEVNTLRFPDIRGSAEYISLQRSYEEVCKERDEMRGQVVEIRMKGEQELENQIRIYREQIREKEVEFEKVRMESMTFRSEIEGYKRDLGNQEAYLIEIDRLKKEVNTLRFPDIRGSAEYSSLQRSYEEVCKERDGLRGQVVEIRMKGEQDLENQIRLYREQIREKEVEFEKVRMESMTFRSEIEGYKRDLGNQEAYLIEIDRLKKEVDTLRFPDIRGSAEFISLQRTYEEVCKERDALRGQVVDIKIKGEQTVESQVKMYREEIREKEVEMNRLRTEIMTFKAEIEGLKRELTTNKQRSEIEIERVKKESTVVIPSVIRNSAEFVTLQRSYDAICLERDSLRKEIMEIRTKNEREVTIHIDNQVRMYREEMKEKDTALERLRSESITLRAEVETLRRDLRVAKETTVIDTKTEQELFNLRTRFAKLQEEYDTVILAKNKLEEEMVIKVNSGMADKQDYIYKLEKENRELKSENEYYEKTVDEKNTTIGDLRLKITKLQQKAETLRKELFVAEEAYEKAELRLKEVLKADYQPVTTYEVRRFRTSTVDSPTGTYSSSTTTYNVNKASSDADALHFSATSTPVKSPHDGERTEVIRKSGVITTGPLDSDLARAEGNYQSSTGTSSTTTKTTVITDKTVNGTSDGVAESGSGSASSYRSSYYSSGPSSYRTGGATSYRTTSGRVSVSGGSYRASGPVRKYSSRKYF